MEFETVTREIGGRHTEIRVLPAKIGRKALMRLTKRIAPAVADLLGGKDLAGTEDLGLLDVDVSAAIRRLAADVEEDDLDYFCDLFAAYTNMEAVPGSGKVPPLAPNFDLIFAKNYPAMMAWLWACLEVNFGGFFDGQGGSLGGLLASVKGKAGK